MLAHDWPSSIQAIAQIGASRFPENVRAQQLKGFEGIPTLPEAQSRHWQILVSQVEQAVTTSLIFMQHADQARQVRRKLDVYAHHFRVRDHADLRRRYARIQRFVPVQQDRQVGSPAQAERGCADANRLGAEGSRFRGRLPGQPIRQLIKHRNRRRQDRAGILSGVTCSRIKGQSTGNVD